MYIFFQYWLIPFYQLSQDVCDRDDVDEMSHRHLSSSETPAELKKLANFA